MCAFLMNLMSERMNSGSAVRTTCDMKKEATPETLCTWLPPLLRKSRKQIPAVSFDSYIACSTHTCSQ